jgi:hypothetical protein
MLGKLLGFSRMHEKKNIFIFLEEINLKNLRFFLIFKETF